VADPAVEKLVPAAIRAKGTLTVAADASYAPDEFVAPDGRTVVGMDPDLVDALAPVMGLRAKMVKATFSTILPGVASGRYDLGASSIADTKAREKLVDFVDYFVGGESFYTPTSGGTSITGMADICGTSVAVEQGTTEEADARSQSAKCVAAGKPAVKLLRFSNQTEANRAVTAGQAKLGFVDSPVAEYQVKQSGGKLKLVGASYANTFDGLVTAKRTGLAQAVLAALRDVTQSGQYLQILTRWGIQADAIPASELQINGATS
jgi:polar amino acid transport system substrate-binding protein